MHDQHILQKAIGYIEDHLHEPLTLEIVASNAGFSKYHFHRVFQKETGMTIGDYIRLRRLAKAASMLLYKTGEGLGGAIKPRSFRCGIHGHLPANICSVFFSHGIIRTRKEGGTNAQSVPFSHLPKQDAT
ncbi:MAG: hypothetical protein BAA01_09950 [Bacillus thermozeamaize]|uniref:HTH araC/xylS-type domain-containing protein n=1 Tax=Bacillus thermozeamaize TaxID=230954 RepID=A0A1Y3PFS1_9BACI|nr:MAG: hypothetical protein BAA01_09950 [Bacillus thermozeamaize]